MSRRRGKATDLKVYPAPAGFPKEVKIRGKVFTVTYATPLAEERGRPLAGRVEHHTRTILIDPHAPPHYIREVILHEMAHVYLTELGRWKNLDDLQEKLCDLFASAFADVIENNPRF